MASRERELDLECTLCKDTFRKPKTLKCLHSFCLECLEIYVERNHSNINLSCPICRTPFQIQQKQQLSNFPTDSYLLNTLNIHNSLSNSISQQKKKQKLMCSDEKNEATSYCLDCQEYFCDICTNAHQTMKISKNHQLILIDEMKNENQIKSISKSNPQLYCQIHEQKEMDMLCEDCKLSICSLCVDNHPSHKISTLTSTIVGNEKQLLTNLIKKVKPKEKKLREGIKKCEEMIKELEINSTTTQTQIYELFNNIRSKLNEKEQELLNKLDEMERFKKKELELQIEELQFGIESIIGSCQIIENSLALSNNNKNDIQLISMKSLYLSRLNYLSNNVWKIEPCHNSFIEFSIDKEQSVYSTISNIGMIDSNEISAEKSLILRSGKQKIYKNEEYSFKIISYSKEGNEMKKGGYGKNFKIQIQDESNNEEKKHESKIIDLKNGVYEVKMKLKDEGGYLIFVQYDGIEICSSPVHIQVFPKVEQRNYNEINEPKLTFGSKGNGNGNGQLRYPCGITLSSKGNILVTDFGNDRIQIFDSEGKFISTFGSKGNGNGQFRYPKGITINSKGNILVCDNNNHRIQIFDSEGNFIFTFGSEGYENGQFWYPYGICVDFNDNIYVCDHENHRIQIFDSKGKFISTFGSYGSMGGQLHGPIGIAINSKGNIIVSDSGNHRIQIFDSEGNSISTFELEVNEEDELGCAGGLCVDFNDNILVCNRDNNRIQIYDSNGEFISQFKVNFPTGITIDPKTQNLIVCGFVDYVSIF